MPASTRTIVDRPPTRSRRDDILDVALDLMSEHGAAATSMRSLATACNVNVAALYHYFPSKADLLRSVIEERRYALRLQDVPAIDVSLPPQVPVKSEAMTVRVKSVEDRQALLSKLTGVKL